MKYFLKVRISLGVVNSWYDTREVSISSFEVLYIRDFKNGVCIIIIQNQLKITQLLIVTNIVYESSNKCPKISVEFLDLYDFKIFFYYEYGIMFYSSDAQSLYTECTFVFLKSLRWDVKTHHFVRNTQTIVVYGSK